MKEDPRLVALLEEKLGVIFPDLLKGLYTIDWKSHLGPIRAISNSRLNFDLHSVGEPDNEYYGSSIMKEYEWMKSILPHLTKVIPIGSPGNGDQVCLDYRSSNEPTVVMLDHEIAFDDPEPFHPLADSFKDLLDRQYEE